MPYVIIDCGGFKEIKSTDKPNAIRELQDKFKNATIEGDNTGRAKLLSGDDIARMFNGRSDKPNNVKSVLEANVKPVQRKGR